MCIAITLRGRQAGRQAGRQTGEYLLGRGESPMGASLGLRADGSALESPGPSTVHGRINHSPRAAVLSILHEGAEGVGVEGEGGERGSKSEGECGE